VSLPNRQVSAIPKRYHRRSEICRHHPDVQFTWSPPAALAPVTGWHAGLRFAVDNLLRNAAIHGEGPVDVRLVPVPGAVRVEVADRGPGLPPDEVTTIRERFVRGSGARGTGSGLGLAIADQQACLHGGSLSLTGNDFGGTTVTIELPQHTPS